MGRTKKAEEARQIKDLENPKDYYYNKENDSYVVFIKSLAKNIVIRGETHRGILNAYSGEDPRSIEDICTTFGIPRSIFNEYKSVFGITRDALSITDEEVEENTVEESVESLLEKKKFEIGQIYAKKSWEQTQKEAEKWREFKAKQLDPLSEILNKWTPPKIDVPVLKIKKPDTTKSLIINLTDTHGGAFSDETLMQGGKGWGKDKFLGFFEKYKNKIKEIYTFYKPSEIALFSLGDILDGLKGETEKGTRLEQDLNRDGQFDLVLSAIVDFTAFLFGLGVPLKIHNVRGNHDGVSAYILFEAVKLALKNTGVEIFNYHTQIGVFKMRNTMFILTHGASDVIDAKLPKHPAREAYAQRIIMNHKDIFKQTKNCVLIAGDVHHREMMEYANFDCYIVGSPARSLYADRLNLHARPSQTCFILTDEGIEQTINVFFD